VQPLHEKRGRRCPRNRIVEEAGRQLGGRAKSRRSTRNTWYGMAPLQGLFMMGVDMEKGLPLPLTVLYEFR
jgi:hypothetical protein